MELRQIRRFRHQPKRCFKNRGASFVCRRQGTALFSGGAESRCAGTLPVATAWKSNSRLHREIGNDAILRRRRHVRLARLFRRSRLAETEKCYSKVLQWRLRDSKRFAQSATFQGEEVVRDTGF